jgi:transposase
MKGTVTLNSKEQHRLGILNRVIGGQMTVMEAARLLDLSERQTRRLLAAYKKEGAAALAHGNRGRTPANALPEALRQQVVALAKGTYGGINHQYLSELLAEREAITISRPSLRRILLAAGLPSHRKRRPPKHRRRRERYPQEGMLLQLDASRHRWLGEDGPWLSLLAAVDDATGKVVGALFREQEDAQGYFLLLQDIVKTYGRPLAVYHDAHGVFCRNDRHPLTLREQLAGTREPTQFGRLLTELGIASITAHSPQAKGRVERLFGTFQERLVVELRLAGAKTALEANRVLAPFLGRFNHRFAVPPATAGGAYLPLPEDLRPREVFCFKYWRSVGMDNTVRLGQVRLQIEPGPGWRTYARAKVQVHERLDGSLAVYHEGHLLASKEAPPEAPVLRLQHAHHAQRTLAIPAEQPPAAAVSPSPKATGPRSSKPGPNHPWRTPFRQARMTDSLNTNPDRFPGQ